MFTGCLHLSLTQTIPIIDKINTKQVLTSENEFTGLHADAGTMVFQWTALSPQAMEKRDGRETKSFKRASGLERELGKESRKVSEANKAMQRKWGQ